MRIAIVMAAYQEAEALENLLPLIAEQCAPAGADCEVVVVNDWGSRDHEMEACCARHGARLINAPCNLGSQGAVLHGLRSLFAGGQIPPDIVVTMDSDGQDDARALPVLIEAHKNNPHSIVVAQRVGRRPEGGRFSLGYSLYKIGFHLLTGIRPDFGNYAVYSGKTAERIAFSPAFGLAYSMALPLMAPLVRVPVRRLGRLHGETRVGWSGLFDHALKSTLPHLGKIAMRVGFLASLLGSLSLLVALVTIGIKIVSPENAFPNWTTQVVSFSVLFSVQMLTISILLFLTSCLSRQISSIRGFERQV